jgi:hypothetical protein
VYKIPQLRELKLPRKNRASAKKNPSAACDNTPLKNQADARYFAFFRIKHASFANNIQSGRWAHERRWRDEIHVTDFGGFAGERWLG